MKALADLSEREVLALAIANEEEDSRIYQSFADRLRPEFDASAHVFEDMAEEERGHRESLYALYRQRFGEHLPPIRREDVRGFMRRRTPWWEPSLNLDKMRGEAELMEREAGNFYEQAASQAADVSVRQLFTHLAEVERGHERRAEELSETHLTKDTQATEESARRRAFVLQYVQPGLAGLIDGSVSTLAPLFAAAFATHNTWETFLVGMAASVGAGISMGFTEALSDDGIITGRGSPVLRGVVCGVMTTLGGVGHSLPYLIPNAWPNAFYLATLIASVVVAVELLAISWIRTKYMDTPFLRATYQVVVGGVLVLLAGILIGSA
jgi:rubrerythrin